MGRSRAWAWREGEICAARRAQTLRRRVCSSNPWEEVTFKGSGSQRLRYTWCVYSEAETMGVMLPWLSRTARKRPPPRSTQERRKSGWRLCQVSGVEYPKLEITCLETTERQEEGTRAREA